MQTTAVFVAIFAAILVSLAVALALPFFLSSERYNVAQEKARARRLAEAKMNARLLRLNL